MFWTWKKKINAFVGGKDSKDYRFLDEMLTRNLCSLDKIEAAGRDDVRRRRKKCVESINLCVSILESKAKTNQVESAHCHENNNQNILNEELPPTPEVEEHIESVHDLETIEIVSKKRTYSNDALACNSCDKSFSVKSALHQHVESVHEGNGFKCDMCKKKFSARSSMVQHIDSVHEGRNNNISPNEASENKESDQRENINYKCNYCEKTFPMESSLKQHVEFVHDGNKCFECDICDIKYSRRSSLFQHCESVH